MGKSQYQTGNNFWSDLSVPLPIQTFFWRQTSPFIRPGQGSLCDASCVNFERVVVQNILHGLSPSLCEAIQSVSRWKVIQAACPHLMHACLSLLSSCKKDITGTFGLNETKLLYTLHWILLDAASECEDADAENFKLSTNDRASRSTFYMHSLSTVHLYVYLFAPIIHLLKESDFNSLKLENGLALWRPLWNYQQPDIFCFSAAVKPSRSKLTTQKNVARVHTNAANIYIGNATPMDDVGEVFCGDGIFDLSAGCNKNIRHCASELSVFTPDFSSDGVELLCEFCNAIMPMNSNTCPQTCRCGQKDTMVAFFPDATSFAYVKVTGGMSRDSAQQKLVGSMVGGARRRSVIDVLSASYLDIAVLKCLFCLCWQDEGIYWSLRYIHKRMVEMHVELCHSGERERSRSRSLPIADLLDLTLSGEKSVMSLNDPKSGNSHDQQYCHSEIAESVSDKKSVLDVIGQPGFARKVSSLKRLRTAELKNLFDSGLSFLKHRDTLESNRAHDHSLDVSRLESMKSSLIETRDDSLSSHANSMLVIDQSTDRPSSALIFPNRSHALDKESFTSPMLCAESKTTPASYDKDSDLSGNSCQLGGMESMTMSNIDICESTECVPKPIIKITNHSPETNLINAQSSLQERDTEDEKLCFGLTRSFTDSSIPYKEENERSEVVGSKFFIQENGHINYMVVLRAVHFVSMKTRVPRINEALLNILICLFDMGLIEEHCVKETKGDDIFSKSHESISESQQAAGRYVDSSIGVPTAHNLALDSVFRIYKTLGCPHGCGDALTGSQGEYLRTKAKECLKRLHEFNPPLFHKFFVNTACHRSLQDTMAFLHAYLGFCLDPVASTRPFHASKMSTSQEALPRNGYANNFGHSIGGEGYRGVEGVLVANIVRPFVTRCVQCIKELFCNDNIGLFSDVRQLLIYFKEVHGGTFRRVALSGLLDSLRMLHEGKSCKPDTKQKVFTPDRKISMTSEGGDENYAGMLSSLDESYSHSGKRKSHMSIFRKRLSKYATSNSELADDFGSRSPGKLSPRTSVSIVDDQSSGSNTPQGKFSRFNLVRRYRAKSNHNDDQLEPGLDRYDSKSDLPSRHSSNQMSFLAASHTTLSLLTAKKRFEDGVRGITNQKKANRVNSEDIGQSCGTSMPDAGSAVHFGREKKLVDCYIVKSGMLRFSFMVECCRPGLFPDAPLLAAMLNLDAPVLARAGILLECAHFVHRCNRGDWPHWMRHNLPSFRNNAGAFRSRGRSSGHQGALVLQRSAGRCFHGWAESLGSQLEFLLAKMHTNRLSVIEDIKDEDRQWELRVEDEEEDFLDDATVNPNGTDCPYALMMLGCLVLLEITTFLRETFQHLPRRHIRPSEHGFDKFVFSRRFSSIISSPGHSDMSSDANVVELPPMSSGINNQVGRKISFAVSAERSSSLHSSTTSLSAVDPSASFSEDKKEIRDRHHMQSRSKLLRRARRGSGHNSSFRHNCSFKVTRPDGAGGGSIKLRGSSRSRKISSHSLSTEAKLMTEDGASNSNFEEIDAMNILSDEAEVSPVDREEEDVEDEDLCSSFPWMRVVVQLANLSNFICCHQGYCHPHCYQRQRRSCSRLTSALKKMLGSTEAVINEENSSNSVNKDDFMNHLKRRDSSFTVTSPRRKESTPLLEKIKSDVSMAKVKVKPMRNNLQHQDMKCDTPMSKYLLAQAKRLAQCPMAIVSKAATVLQVEHFVDMMPVAWELLLETDQELASSAATVFLLSSVKSPDKASNMLIREMQHEEANQRINAIIRFGTLWKFRYQVWPRMECDASMHFKLPPPSIDFTLPSPTIGLPKASLSVVDPPWLPHLKTKIEEVTINQEETKSLVTATTTRRKQQQEMICKALLAEEDRKRVGRENFPITTVSVTQLASNEPALHSSVEEQEEAAQEEVNFAARRVSLAPTNRSNAQSRSMSCSRGDEDRSEHSHRLQTAQSFFPSCICTAVLPILHLLDDHDVNVDGVSVSEVANKIIWDCIVDDPILFLRHFLEKLTNKEKQEEFIFLLRKLVVYFRQLPAQTAHTIFNYLVVPCVEGIYFKDLKQMLKKEQCDPHLLVSANVASAKKILVNGPDLSSIPSQLPIHEDTQFIQILHESLDFFNIPDDQHHCHFLVDTKTQLWPVCDRTIESRSNAERVALKLLIHKKIMFPVFILKFIEIGKVLLTNAVLENNSVRQAGGCNHVAFLFEELLRLPSFPRKALETEFDMYNGEWGKELYGVDSLHKYCWTKLIMTMFRSVTATFTWSSDLSLFISIINGTLLLLFEDIAVLRFCLASLINTCQHFKHVFATNGFFHVMPTLLRVYSNNQSNTVLTGAIQFVCQQFYMLHRKPFVLQTFGSVASLLDTGGDPASSDTSKIQPDSLFMLLLSLETDQPDSLGILDFVQGEKPLKPMDFCYSDDQGTFCIKDVINMCVTVVAFAPDSFRSLHMLVMLEMVIPRYLEHLYQLTKQRDSVSTARDEVSAITNIGAAVRTLINCTDYFARSMGIAQKFLEASNMGKQNHRHTESITVDDREDSHASHRMEEGQCRPFRSESDDRELCEEFRHPRDSVLSIAAQFWTFSSGRLRHLRKTLADPSFRFPDLLDNKSHNRLAEIAHTLLKLIPYDPYTISCTGLQRYMLEILPSTDWSQESVRPALTLILRRLDRLFSKMSKKSSLRRHVDWTAAANILKGVYHTLKKFAYIAYLPHLKTLVSALISILMTGVGEANPLCELGQMSSNEPEVAPVFCSAVVKLVTMQMQALGESYTLEHTCGGVSPGQPSGRLLALLTSFILPLCIRVGCGRQDIPKLLMADIKFVLTAVTSFLNPAFTTYTTGSSRSSSIRTHRAGTGDWTRVTGAGKSSLRISSELQHVAAFIGLEVLAVCFDRQLACQWPHVAKLILNLASKGKVGLPMWRFLDFLVTHRFSLFMLLHTFIKFRMMCVNCDTAQEYYLQQTIKDKLHGYNNGYQKSTSTVLLQLSVELQHLRAQLRQSSSSGSFHSWQTHFSHMQQTDRQMSSKQTDIAAEIIGPRWSPVNCGLSPSHSSQQPFGTFEVGVGKQSEACPQRSGKRVIAQSGSLILEKLSSQRAPLKNGSPTGSLTSGAPHVTQQQQTDTCPHSPSLIRSSLDGQCGGEKYFEAFENERSAMAGDGATSLAADEADSGALDDQRESRLQRQDARSRKTFKIKSQKRKHVVNRFISQRRRPSQLADINRFSKQRVPVRLEQVLLGDADQKRHKPHGWYVLSRSIDRILEAGEVKQGSREPERLKSDESSALKTGSMADNDKTIKKTNTNGQKQTTEQSDWSYPPISLSIESSPPVSPVSNVSLIASPGANVSPPINPPVSLPINPTVIPPINPPVIPPVSPPIYLPVIPPISPPAHNSQPTSPTLHTDRPDETCPQSAVYTRHSSSDALPVGETTALLVEEGKVGAFPTLYYADEDVF